MGHEREGFRAEEEKWGWSAMNLVGDGRQWIWLGPHSGSTSGRGGEGRIENCVEGRVGSGTAGRKSWVERRGGGGCREGRGRGWVGVGSAISPDSMAILLSN